QVELGPDPRRGPPTESPLVVPEGGQGEERQAVAGVDGQGRTVETVQGRGAPPELAVVLHVVVDEEGGVEQLDGGGRGKSGVETTTECLAGRQTQRRTQALAAPMQVVGGRFDEILAGVERNIGKGLAARSGSVIGEQVEECESGGHADATRSDRANGVSG